ncbi:MAG: hypothetical protein MHMPM18_002247 [Marteilia pararefringens]
MNELKSGFSHRSAIVERPVSSQTARLASDSPHKELRKTLVFVKTYSKSFDIFDYEETERALYNCSELGICPHVYEFSKKELVTEFIDIKPIEDGISELNHVDLLAEYHAANHRDFRDYRAGSNHMPFCQMIHELLERCKQICADDYKRMAESMKPRDFDHELQKLNARGKPSNSGSKNKRSEQRQQGLMSAWTTNGDVQEMMNLLDRARDNGRRLTSSESERLLRHAAVLDSERVDRRVDRLRREGILRLASR